MVREMPPTLALETSAWHGVRQWKGLYRATFNIPRSWLEIPTGSEGWGLLLLMPPPLTTRAGTGTAACLFITRGENSPAAQRPLKRSLKYIPL